MNEKEIMSLFIEIAVNMLKDYLTALANYVQLRVQEETL